MMEQQRERRNGQSRKYHGKWPFLRIMGMQEVLSVLFSVANMAVHKKNVRKLLQAKQADLAVSNTSRQQYWKQWLLYAVCAVNAWFWSAVFHSRDTYVTERFDYLSADLSIFVGLYVSVVLTAGTMTARKQFACGVTVLAGLVMLCRHMLFVKFDYGLNVGVCLVVGVFQQLLWCSWAVYKKHPGRKQLLTFVALINAALGLEVFDFPPIGRLLDAHALWHLCTVPLTMVWYKFVFCDAEWRFQETGVGQVAVKRQ